MASLVNNAVFTATSGGTGAFGVSAAVTGHQTPAAAGVVDTTKSYRYRAESGDKSEWEIGTTVASSTATSFTRVVTASSAGGTTTVNFTAAPTVAISMMAADVLQFDDTMSLTAAQQAIGRSNLYAAPLDAVAFNGMQVNGSVDVAEDLGTTGATLATSVAKHIADCIMAQYTNSSAVVTSAQLAAASFPAALSGYSNGHQIKATTKFPAQASLSNGDYCLHRFLIEGYRIASLGFGASGAQSFSYGVQVYSTNAGTIFLKFSNSTYARCYYQEQTVAAGWNWLTGTISGDTSGTWQATTSIGLRVEIFSVGKAASPVAPGSWGATDTTQTTNSASVLSTTNNDQTIATGLIVVPGTEVPTSARAPFIMRPYDQEVLLCKRYLHVLSGMAIGQAFAAGLSYNATFGVAPYIFPVQMRATPTFSESSYAHVRLRNMFGAFDGTAASSFTGNGYSGRLDVTVAAASLTPGQALIVEAASTSLKFMFDARLA